MPFLPVRIAVLALLCALFVCAQPHGAAAAQPGAADVFSLDEPQEPYDAYPPPTLLAPMKKAQTPPGEIERNALEALLKIEDEARLEQEAADLALAREREKHEREERERERLEAENAARRVQEQRQARSAALTEALRTASLPPAAVIPPKREWPLPTLIEDPAWNSPELALIYAGGYGAADIKSLYRLILGEAVYGNPRAMLVLSYAYERWGAGISSSFAVLHPPMHNSAYWRSWALRLTSEDWVELRLGDLSLSPEEKRAHYSNAAVYHNGEALYKLALLEDQPAFLVEAALAGNPEAASIVAFNLGMGTSDFPPAPRQAAAYWWRGALAGDLRSLLVCSELFYSGRENFPKDERRAYIFALLAFEEAQAQGGYTPGSPAARLLGSIERHLDGLRLAMNPGLDELWQLRQDLEIFRAAPGEARLTALEYGARRRAPVLAELEAELFSVRLILESSEAGISEQQILAKLREASPDGEQERSRQVMAAQEEQRQRANFYFLAFAAFFVVIILLGYLSMRLRLYAALVRLVSVGNGETE